MKTLSAFLRNSVAGSPTLSRLAARYRGGRASRARQRVFREQIRGAIAEGKQLAIVYVMPKAASTTIEVSLMQVPELAVFKVHRINPINIRNYHTERQERGVREEFPYLDDLGRVILEEVFEKGRPARVITVVREPIARNVSAYFHILDAIWNTPNAAASIPTSELQTGFMDRGRHRVPLDWFDDEWKAVLGIDIFDHPFPVEKGFLGLTKGPYDTLVLRADLPDPEKERCLGAFLGVDGIKLYKANIAEDKPYAESYQRFIATLPLSDNYLEEMLGSKYTRHFFSPQEIETIYEKWRRPRTSRYS